MDREQPQPEVAQIVDYLVNRHNIIARCQGCGCAIFYSDEDLNLMDWVADADYETTGHRTPYCRECYHEAITRSE